MKPVFSREEMRAFEDELIREGTPSIALMERAGKEFAKLLEKWLAREWLREGEGPILVLAGTGNNGGDAFVVARYLRAFARDVRLVIVGRREKLTKDADTMLERVAPLKVTWIEDEASAKTFEATLAGARLVVDGLFGTGLSRPLVEPILGVVRAVNAASIKKIALDLPSGLDADRGVALGDALRVDRTITMAAWKRGLATPFGASLAGEVFVVPIADRAPLDAAAKMFDLESAKLSPRGPADHKGTAGHLFIIAGSKGKGGAALLSARAALRTGAGLVTLATTKDVAAGVLSALPEVMAEDVSSTKALAPLLEKARLAKNSAIVIGPGIGRDARAKSLLRFVLSRFAGRIVIDADAATLFSSLGKLARPKSQSLLFTPHVGEMATLLKIDNEAVVSDRYGVVSRFAKENKVHAILKGAHSLIADPEGNIVVGPRGTPILGAGGTGDVLSGILGALALRSGFEDAAPLGVALHARAAVIAAARANAFDRGVLATEIADALPEAIAAVLHS